MGERGRADGARTVTPFVLMLLLAGCIPQVAPPDGQYPARNEPRQDHPEQAAPQSYPAPPPGRADSQQDYPQPSDAPQRSYDQGRPDDYVASPRTVPPAWVSRPVTPDAQTISSTTYVVMQGDTLRGIADRTGSGSEAIARANGLAAPYTVRAGERLEIPGGRYHLVRAGQTGIAIARAYGVDWSKVITANDLSEPYILRVGMRILIPGGPVSLAERARAFHIDVDDIVTGGEPAIASNQRPARPSSSSSRILPSTEAIAEPARLKGVFAWPLRGTVVAHFGPGATGEKFNGIKIATPLNTPILASADGVVAYAGNEVANLGGLVILKHGDSWTTVYGNAGQLLVQRGQSVRKGQTIALSGDSGAADRPELHFEIRKGRTPVDPLGQLPKR